MRLDVERIILFYKPYTGFQVQFKVERRLAIAYGRGGGMFWVR